MDFSDLVDRIWTAKSVHWQQRDGMELLEIVFDVMSALASVAQEIACLPLSA